MNKRLFEFIEKSPTAFHTVANICDTLISKGYERLYEGSKWKINKGGKYFVTRNDSSVVAFRIPADDFGGFMIAASHSDSPCFKLKENPVFTDSGYTKFSCEKYGGMINSTWLDRPLSVAGRVVYKDEDSIKSVLVDFKEPVALIPNVAIHLNRKANEESSLNAAVDLVPLVSLEDSTASFKASVAELSGTHEDNILSSDLFLYNADKGVCWSDFISAPRLDDLQCVFAALDAFVSAKAKTSIPVLAVFDNEEVGSSTKQGADSDFLYNVLLKVSSSLGFSNVDFADFLAKSFMLSCDNGHAVHPNHPELTDKNNSVKMNGGIVIKYNANQRYCTDAVSSAIVKTLCRRAEIPFQAYANRSDIAGGSTLGNIANTHLSMITADIGLAQLSMHSSFETAGKDDTEYMQKFLFEFFSSSLNFPENNSYTI
ncbi:MAG: M18 family aminopeptidase [Ruminococcaceae bacterium]|nr:M18 family aminopeptidase [Oscillospiraceae bacterium]